MRKLDKTSIFLILIRNCVTRLFYCQVIRALIQSLKVKSQAEVVEWQTRSVQNAVP